MEKIKLLIVDDRKIIYDAFKSVFANVEDIVVKGYAKDGEEAISMVRNNDYDVVLMDVNMPIMNGVESTKKIQKLFNNVKVLGNSFFADPVLIRNLIKAGVYGFVTKDETKETYVDAIRSVFREEVYLTDRISGEVYDTVLTTFWEAS